MTSQNMDELISSLKECFPKAQKFQIIDTSTHEGPQQNYLSDIIRLTLQYEQDGNLLRQFFIIKAPRNTGFATACSNLDIYDTEIFMYDTMIPRINDYLEESLAPVHFKTVTDSKILILQNLTAVGYEQEENTRQLYGLSQCLPALKALAHFHAATYKAGQMESDLHTNEVFQYPTMFKFKQQAALFWEPIFCQLLAKHDVSFLIPKLKKAILHLQHNQDDVTSSFHQTNFKFSVLNHGDFRKANILFKMDPNGEIDRVKIIDFQLCFWSSPVYDFMYFFVLNPDPDVIDNHYDMLLDWYLQCLNTKLKQIDCSRTYRKEDFIEDLKRLRISSIFPVTATATLLCTADRDQLLQQITREKKENIDHYKEVCLNDPLFTKTILSILKFFDKIGLFEVEP